MIDYSLFNNGPWRQPANWVTLGLIISLLSFATLLWYRRFLKVRMGTVLILWLLTLVLGLAFTEGGLAPAFRSWRPFVGISGIPVRDWHSDHFFQTLWQSIFHPYTFRWLFLIFAVPFVARLYFKWVGEQVTESEKEGGMKGVHAWFGGGNLFCAIVIALCGKIGFGYSFVGLLILTVSSLLLYPLITLATQPPEGVSDSADDLTEERERILRMLDEGKITAEESADLLNALGATTRSGHGFRALSPARKLILIGAALVVIGFFLPWFSVHRGQPIPWFLEMIHADAFKTIESNGVHGEIVSIGTGGQGLSYGLGWLVLLLALGAAFVPWLAREMNPQTQRRLTLWAVILGGFILAVLVFPYFYNVSIGVLFAFLGIMLEFVGVMREQKTA